MSWTPPSAQRTRATADPSRGQVTREAILAVLTHLRISAILWLPLLTLAMLSEKLVAGVCILASIALCDWIIMEERVERERRA